MFDKKAAVKIVFFILQLDTFWKLKCQLQPLCIEAVVVVGIININIIDNNIYD
jgi:hypothetical protein